jgi:hypothetical protein
MQEVHEMWGFKRYVLEVQEMHDVQELHEVHEV